MAAIPYRDEQFPATSPVDSDSLYLAITEGTARFTGEQYLNELVSHLAQVLDVQTVFVGEYLAGKDRGLVSAAIHKGALQSQVELNLANGPGPELLSHGKAVYAAGFRRKYPEYNWDLAQESESMAYVLVRSQSGDPLGVFGVMHSSPLFQVDAVVELLERLAPRVGAESERRQRELVLRRSEARFRLLVEHSRDIVFYYRMQPEEHIEYISPGVLRMVGKLPEAFYANPQTLLDLIDPEYRALVQRMMSTGSEEPIITPVTSSEGSARWIEYRNFPFRDPAGEIVALGGSLRDVTDQVQAEEELARSERYRRALLDAIPDTIFRLDSEGIVLDYVPGEALSEVMNAGDNPVRSISDLLPLAYVTPVRRLLHDAVRSGESQRFEFESVLNNESRTFEVRCIPFASREILLVVRDFTAMKWHAGEPERVRLREELDAKVEGKMKARNPYGLTYRELAVLHLVADGSADKQIAESLGISIYTANKHVGNILGKMNAASRTEAGVRALREGLLG